jgi:light-regulated signal transduction histidine kinase (bacteriophytochrome)
LADRATPLRAQVISVVSHELRTPLTSIASLVGMLEDGSLADRDRADAMASIRRNTERMLGVVDDLAILAGLDMAPASAVDLGAVVRAAAERGVPVTVPDGPPVSGDPELLGQLVRFMLGAVSAVSSAGTVALTGSVGPNGWTLCAHGYATGLDTTEGTLTAGPPALSDPPYRRSVALSVLLAQAIATGHGGSLSFERDPDGRASVTVRLPT